MKQKRANTASSIHKNPIPNGQHILTRQQNLRHILQTHNTLLIRTGEYLALVQYELIVFLQFCALEGLEVDFVGGVGCCVQGVFVVQALVYWHVELEGFLYLEGGFVDDVDVAVVAGCYYFIRQYNNTRHTILMILIFPLHLKLLIQNNNTPTANPQQKLALKWHNLRQIGIKNSNSPTNSQILLIPYPNKTVMADCYYFALLVRVADYCCYFAAVVGVYYLFQFYLCILHFLGYRYFIYVI